MASTQAFKKRLGFFPLLFYGVGAIVGAGIYSVIGSAAAIARDGLWISLSISAIVAVAVAACYAELASAFPKTGAEYVYVREAFPRSRGLSYLTGFLVLLAGVTTAATVATAFAGYVRLFWDAPGWALSAALLSACTALQIAGIRQSSWANVGLTVVELGGLALVIAFGLPEVEWSRAMAPSLHWGVITGSSLVFFVYTGFEGIVNLAEESRDPRENLPRALLAAVTISAVLYVLVAFGALGLASHGRLAGSEFPLATALGSVSPRWAGVIGWAAVVSTANTALVNLIVSSRVLFAMARQKDMPRAFLRLTPAARTPWAAGLAVMTGAALFLPLGEVGAMAGLASFVTLLSFAAVAISLIVLRRRKPGLRRTFSVPGSWAGIPVIPALAVLAIAFLATQFDRDTYVVAGAAMAFGGLAYALLGRGTKGASSWT